MLPERSEVCLCTNHVNLMACKQSCLLTGENGNRCKCNETVPVPDPDVDSAIAAALKNVPCPTGLSAARHAPSPPK
jgi:hypothetical protein